MKLQVCSVGENDEEILSVVVVGMLKTDGLANRISILYLVIELQAFFVSFRRCLYT
jgi:hypothetical protein